MAKKSMGKFIIDGKEEELFGEGGYWDHDLFNDIFTRITDKKKQYTLENGVRVLEITYVDSKTGKNEPMFLIDDSARTDGTKPMKVAKDILNYHKDKDGNLVLELASASDAFAEYTVPKKDKERSRLNTRLWFAMKSGVVKVVATAVAALVLTGAIIAGTVLIVENAKKDADINRGNSDIAQKEDEIHKGKVDLEIAQNNQSEEAREWGKAQLRNGATRDNKTYKVDNKLEIVLRNGQKKVEGVFQLTELETYRHEVKTEGLTFTEEDYQKAEEMNGYKLETAVGASEALAEDVVALMIANNEILARVDEEGNIQYNDDVVDAIIEQQRAEGEKYLGVNDFAVYTAGLKAAVHEAVDAEIEKGAAGQGIEYEDVNTEDERVVTAVEDKIGESVSEILLSGDGTKAFAVNEDKTKMYEIDLVDENGNPVKPTTTEQLASLIESGNVDNKYDPAKAAYGETGGLLDNVWIAEKVEKAKDNKGNENGNVVRAHYATVVPGQDNVTVEDTDGYWVCYNGESAPTKHWQKLLSVISKVGKDSGAVYGKDGYEVFEDLSEVNVSSYTLGGEGK